MIMKAKGPPTRRLKDYEGIADSMSDFFGPDDCNEGEVLLRRGLMRSSSGVCECVMAYCADDGVFSVFVVCRENEGNWEFEKGRCIDQATVRAISKEIGEPTPFHPIYEEMT